MKFFVIFRFCRIKFNVSFLDTLLLLNLYSKFWVPPLFLFFIYVEFYRPLIVAFVFILVSLLKRIPSIEKLLNLVKQDMVVLGNHWRFDSDLRSISYVINFLTIFGILFMLPQVTSIFVMSKYVTVLDYEEYITLGKLTTPMIYSRFASELFPIGFVSFFCSRLLNFIFSVHIILFRNFPTTLKTISVCAQCAIGIGALATPLVLIDIHSSSLVNKPTTLSNFYNQYSPTGAGYGYHNTLDMVQHEALKASSVYNKEALIDAKFRMFSTEKKEAFIALHKSTLSKELPISACVNLGIKKGYIV